MSNERAAAKHSGYGGLARHALSALITLACFAFFYRQISGRVPHGHTLVSYLASIFASVDWVAWLALMVPYSMFYLLVDTAVLWRVVNWFNAPAGYLDLLPIRGAAYVVSLLNEQVGKGAIAWFLNRRHGVPGWGLASSMLFIMLCEPLYLLVWATIGVSVRWGDVPEIFHRVPLIAGAAALVVGLVILLMRTDVFGSPALRDRPVFTAFRKAGPTRYLIIIALRSPALLSAVFVYSRAAALFGVQIPLADMLCYLPLIFFGTFIPSLFRVAAAVMWSAFYPQHAAEMGVFGLVMHGSFVFFNAALGLMFLPRANRELASA
jgi:hypothetical protein